MSTLFDFSETPSFKFKSFWKDYIAEEEKQLSDKIAYEKVNFKSKILRTSLKQSIIFLKNLKKGIITEKNLNISVSIMKIYQLRKEAPTTKNS